MTRLRRPVQFHVCLLLAGVIFFSANAHAVDMQPGDSCSTFAPGVYRPTGGPENPDGALVVCDGSIWQPILRYSSTGNAVMFSSTGLAAAPVHVWGEVIIGNQGLACAAATEGAIRYNSSGQVVDYCNGAAWTTIGGGSSLWALSGNDIYYNSGNAVVGAGSLVVNRTAANPQLLLTDNFVDGLLTLEGAGPGFSDALAIGYTSAGQFAMGHNTFSGGMFRGIIGDGVFGAFFGNTWDINSPMSGMSSTGLWVRDSTGMRFYQDGTVLMTLNWSGLDAAHALRFSGDISPAQITANQNNYNPTGLAGAAVLRLNSNASRDITGLAGGADGRIIMVTNTGTNDIVLVNQSGSSTAANRFAIGANITLAANQSVTLIYDSTSSRWRAVGAYTGAGGGTPAGSNTQIQFNNGGSFGASAALTWNNATSFLHTEGLSVYSSQEREKFQIGRGFAYHLGNNLVQFFNAFYDNTDSRDEFYGYSSPGYAGRVYFSPVDGNMLIGVSSNSGNDGAAVTWSPNGAISITKDGSVGVGQGWPTAGIGLDIRGSMALAGDISPAQITANQNNYNPAGLADATVLRLNSNASRDITGLAGGADGRVIMIYNTGTNDIVLVNQSGLSTAANRFVIGANITLGGGRGVTLIYDSTSSRWRAVGANVAGGAASAGGSDRQIQFNNAGAFGGVSGLAYNADTSLNFTNTHTATTTGSFDQTRLQTNVQPSAAQAAGKATNGFQSRVTIPFGNTNQIREVKGVYAFAENIGSGPVEKLMAGMSYGYSWAGTTNSMLGHWAEAQADGSSTVPSLIGLGAATTVSTSGTVNAATSLYVEGKHTGGTITNRHGIFMKTPTGTATNDWGIYQEGTQKNYFGGGFETAGALTLSGVLSPPQITANQNNYNPSGLAAAAVLRLNTNAERNITGLAGGAAGRILMIANVGSNNLYLLNESGSSTAANRFAIGRNLYLKPSESVTLFYDAVSSRWRPYGMVYTHSIKLTSDPSASPSMEWFVGAQDSDPSQFHIGSWKPATSEWSSWLWFEDGTKEIYMNPAAPVKLVVNGWGPARATLDVRGYAKLQLNSSAPVTCNSNHHGSIAATSNGSMCFCKTTNVWRNMADSAACSW